MGAAVGRDSVSLRRWLTRRISHSSLERAPGKYPKILVLPGRVSKGRTGPEEHHLAHAHVDRQARQVAAQRREALLLVQLREKSNNMR